MAIITVPTPDSGRGYVPMNVSIDDAGGQLRSARDGAWDLVVQGNGIGSGPVALIRLLSSSSPDYDAHANRDLFPRSPSVLTYGIMVAEAIALDNTTRHAPGRAKEKTHEDCQTGGAGFIGANFVHTRSLRIIRMSTSSSSINSPMRATSVP